jgi:hypothetical protein
VPEIISSVRKRVKMQEFAYGGMQTMNCQESRTDSLIAG